ncbi:MAG: tetratricopeptide repeat protein [Terriglobia bacterium]
MRRGLLLCALLLFSPLFFRAQASTSDVSSHLSKANQAYASQNWKVAADEYRSVVRLDPQNAEAYARLGVVYQRLGQWDDSRQSLQKALDLKPGLRDVDVLLAFVDIRLQEYPKAISLLANALRNTRDDPPLRLAGGERLVDLYFMEGDQAQGVDAVEKLRQLAPDDPDVLYTASRAYSALWKSVVERMYTKAPNSYRTHQVLALAAEAKGNYAEAAKEYRIVVKMAPQLPGAHYQLGRMILESDSTPQGAAHALGEFQKELEVDPIDAPSYDQIGELDLKMHRLDEAEQQLSKAVQLAPSYGDARVGLGKVFMEKKQFQAAAEQLEQATRLAPNNQTAFYELMIADRALGRNDQAKAALAKFEQLREQAKQQESNTLKQLEAPLDQGPVSVSSPHP